MNLFRALGLMSGSSLDGLDLALCHIKMTEGRVMHWELKQAGTLPFSEQWQKRLSALPAASAFELARAHADFGHYMGELTQTFFLINNLRAGEIDFIASHGHTVFHEPVAGFTTQIGDGAALATATGCTVISDFRSSDVALGGQGAPLAPIADWVLFRGYDFYLNLGGIANITCNANGKFIAYDITGANQLLNALAHEAGLTFDKDGELAASGEPGPDLLKKLNSQLYFEQPYPKSISNQWVQNNLVSMCLTSRGTVPSKLRTACEHIALQTAGAVTAILEKEDFRKENYKIFVTGGGAFNKFLMKCIRDKCNQKGRFEIVLPEAKIIQFKEACLMALLGTLRMEGLPNCFSSVTGARKDAIGGAIFSAQ